MIQPTVRGSLYIDGRWRQADSGSTIDVINPATEEAFIQGSAGARRVLAERRAAAYTRCVATAGSPWSVFHVGIGN